MNTYGSGIIYTENGICKARLFAFTSERNESTSSYRYGQNRRADWTLGIMANNHSWRSLNSDCTKGNGKSLNTRMLR